MRNNKAFQTIIGAFVVITCWRLFREGWFDLLMSQPVDGDQVESVDLIAMLFGAVLSALQMVGLLCIGIVAGLLPLVQSLFDGAINLIKPSKPNIAIILVIVLVVFLFVRNDRQIDVAPDPELQNAIVIVPPVGQAASMKVDQWATENGFEVRRYSENADLSTAEPYLQILFDEAIENAPCAVVSKNGSLQVIQIDDDFLKTLDGIK